MKKDSRIMTPQAMLKARFVELAEGLGLTLGVRRQSDKFYFVVTGEWRATETFIKRTFPGAWMTSGATEEIIYRLPPDQVERTLTSLQIEPAWLQQHDGLVVQLARTIRLTKAFTALPELADALVACGCTNSTLLEHCRAGEPHQETCWVIELLLGVARDLPTNSMPSRRS
jgi:hypothetical protein